jgi:Mn2+/Fe2+ NRAMP family transporter
VRGRGLAIGALLAVVGPGLLAGLSDDDPAGITTYSVLGADYGYQLLWVLLLSTVALVMFHALAARMGVVTGQGLIGLVRQRYGVRLGGAVLAALVVANVGTTCAEFAGIAAGFELFGIGRYFSVPVAALIVSVLVLRGSFHRIERLLLLLSTVFLAYIASGVLAQPDWGAAVHGLVVPTMPATGDAIAIVTATVGTTLAPWGLSFIQSYAVDKKLRTQDLFLERIDVVTGAVLTGVIGFFVVVACAATLHRDGRSIADAADAAVALQPLAGDAASTLFAVGLIYIGVLSGLQTVVQLRAPQRYRGRVLSFFLVALGVAYPAGSLVQGPLIDRVGIGWATAGSALLLSLIMLLTAWRRPAIARALTGEHGQQAQPGESVH